MLKKTVLIFLLFVLFTGCVYAKKKQKKPKILPEHVMAPAVQFNLKDYKDYFKKSSDLKLNLQSKNEYVLTCESDILGINWGDVENIKIYDYKNENNENDMKKAIIKTKYETYSYIRLYKATGEILNLLVSVNPAFEVENKISLGLCEVEQYLE